MAVSMYGRRLWMKCEERQLLRNIPIWFPSGSKCKLTQFAQQALTYLHDYLTHKQNSFKDNRKKSRDKPKIQVNVNWCQPIDLKSRSNTRDKSLKTMTRLPPPPPLTPQSLHGYKKPRPKRLACAVGRRNSRSFADVTCMHPLLPTTQNLSWRQSATFTELY